jgi:hypothetical protein
MKNRYKIIGLFIVIAVFFTGCDEQLTDIPENQFTEIQVFSTVNGVETAVNGMYARLQAYDYYGARMRLLLWPHSGKYHSKQGANSDANRLDVTNTNINLDKLWRGMWKTINQINIVITNVEGSGLDNEATSLGQAHFLRAVVYFDLVRMFEETPIRITPTTKDDIHIAKSTKEELYNLIIADLKKAAELLPNRGEYIDGRPLKYAANAYLAKVYITLAGRNDATVNFPGFNSITESEITAASISNFWEEAKTELDYVISNGGYALTSTFFKLFEDGTRNTSESIFELQYGHTGAVRTNDIMRDVVAKNHPIIATGTNSFGRIRPNKEMFNDHIIQYSGIDYTGIEFIPAGSGSDEISLDVAVADSRINETYVFNSYNRTTNGNLVKVFPLKNKGNDAYAYLKKYRDQSYDGTTTFNNIILLRYADILLLRAEVENEISGPSTAYAYVNQVLLRARTTNTGSTVQPADWNDTSVATQEDFRERIMKEREYELNGEGHEWFDMRRRGLERFQEQINHHNAAVDSYSSEGNRDFIFLNVETEVKFPIPLAEISGNNLIDE